MLFNFSSENAGPFKTIIPFKKIENYIIYIGIPQSVFLKQPPCLEKPHAPTNLSLNAPSLNLPMQRSLDQPY